MEQNPVTRKQLLGGGALAGALALGAAPAAQAHGGDERHRRLVVGDDHRHRPAARLVRQLISFHEGGVVNESRRYYVPATPLGPLLETTGHGSLEAHRLALVRGRSSLRVRWLRRQAATPPPRSPRA